MKRILAAIALSVVFLGVYFLTTFAVRRYFLFGPGPFTIGKVAIEYFMPQAVVGPRNELLYDEDLRVAVFASISLASVAIPLYLLLTVMGSSRRSRLHLP
jgi:hypothetical protein